MANSDRFPAVSPLVESLETRRLLAAAYTLVEVPTFAGFSHFFANGMNDSGHVVGTATKTSTDDTGVGFVFRNNAVQQVAGSLTAEDINNSGRIVGIWNDPSVSQPLGSQGYITDATTGALINLDASKSNRITPEPRDINNDSVVVGRNIFQDSGDGSAFYWQNGTLSSVPIGEGFINGAVALNDSELIVGEIGLIVRSEAFRWVFGSAQAQNITPVPDDGPPPNQLAVAVNASGQILVLDQANGATLLFQGNGPGVDIGNLDGAGFTLGNAISDSGIIIGTAGGKAFIKENGAFSDLNNLVTNKPGNVTFTDAVAINASGQIVVNGTKAGNDRAFILTPVSAPQSGAVSGVVYNDQNGNGARNGAEPALVGWTVYTDQNDNGVLDGNEASANTGADGSYTIAGLAPGNYRIRELVKTGFTRTQPAGTFPQGFYDVTVVSGQTVTGRDFGNQSQGGGGTNVAPTAGNDSASTVRGFPVTINVLGNDTDSDGSLVPSSIAFGDQPDNGSLDLNPATGQVSYTPVAGFVGTDTFTYTVKDDDGATSAPATVTVTVREVGGNLPGPDLAATDLSTNFPAAAVGGAKARNAKAKLTVGNVGDTDVRGLVTARLFLSSDTTLDGGDTLISESTKNARFKPGREKRFNLKVREFPSLPDGSYRVLATLVYNTSVITDTDPSNDTAVANEVITLAAPFVDLNSTFASLPISPLTVGKSSKATVRIENAGNTDYKGQISTLLLSSEDQVIDGLDPSLDTVDKNFTIKAGKAKQVRLAFQPQSPIPQPGVFLAASITGSASSPASSDLTDSVISNSPFTVA